MLYGLGLSIFVLAAARYRRAVAAAQQLAAQQLAAQQLAAQQLAAQVLAAQQLAAQQVAEAVLIEVRNDPKGQLPKKMLMSTSRMFGGIPLKRTLQNSIQNAGGEPHGHVSSSSSESDDASSDSSTDSTQTGEHPEADTAAAVDEKAGELMVPPVSKVPSKAAPTVSPNAPPKGTVRTASTVRAQWEQASWDETVSR
ncbi:unnamed protein product [Symbiodinium microadriaticum]|nr:unnamed protein product [Symbiodinium microadriaticum]